MPTYRKARQLATEFENVYPEALPKRLAWWCRVLGVDRSRFLRMMGMSPDEAIRQANSSWEAILKKKECEEDGWWVEGKLHDLVALFDYDWKALAKRLHQTAEAHGQELNGATRKKRDIEKQAHVSSGKHAEVLLDQLAKGGPQSFSALIAYLSGGALAGEHAS
jgi:hypothetical protein